MWKDKFSCLTGAISSTSVGFVALSDDSVDHRDFPFSQLAFWHQGVWGNNGQTDFPVVSISHCAHPVRQVIVMGPWGETFLTGSGDVHQETVQSNGEGPQQRGELRAVRGIGGKAYAVGMQRQVYRRDGQNVWTCIDGDIRPEPGQVVGFESVDGFGADEIYAVGWEGEIWRYDGETWHQISSPTNFILTGVCCAGDGQVYVCGRFGMLLSGRKDQWRVINHESMTEDIWSLAWFKGSLYAATYHGLFKLDGDKLDLVEMGEDTPLSSHKLSANNDLLWSIGAKDIMAFDGNTWTRIE